MNNFDEIAEIVKNTQANKMYWFDAVMKIVESIENATNNQVVMLDRNWHLTQRAPDLGQAAANPSNNDVAPSG